MTPEARTVAVWQDRIRLRALKAACPARASRLVLIDPSGLWRDDAPVVNWMML